MEIKAINKIQDTIRDTFISDDVLWNNEIKANMLVAASMFNLAVVVIVSWILNNVGVFDLEVSMADTLLVQTLAELLLPFALCTYYKGAKKWLKVVMLIELIVVLSRVDAQLMYNVTLCMVIPVVLSARYYNGRLTAVIAVLTMICFSLSAWYGALHGTLDANYVDMFPGAAMTVGADGFLKEAIYAAGFDRAEYVKEILVLGFMPKAFIFTVVAIVSVEIARRGRDLVLEEYEISTKNARISSELALATQIQADLLPKTFPPYPERKDLDIFACMDPAKEVGGDFYDFFMIDEDRLAVVVGDVSDKGVPAALFMVTARTLIKDHALLNSDLGQVFTDVNRLLCEGNEAGLFVTAWMAVINLKTGHVNFVNAGHNPPIIKRAGGECIYLKTKPNLVLAGIDGIRYKGMEEDLGSGDVLYIYTDGVTDAINQTQEDFGTQRLMDIVSSCSGSMEELCLAVKDGIEQHVGGVQQFDDITMLAFRYVGGSKLKLIQVDADVQNVPVITDFADQFMEENGFPESDRFKVDIAIDEIFSNIAYYAYRGDQGGAAMTIDMSEDPLGVVLKFYDGGFPYNPLAKEDPDVSLPLKDRPVGGLGIMMVKKLMDEVSYEYSGGKNIFTIKKYMSDPKDAQEE